MTAKYLVFDTETSGLPQRWDAPSTDLANWPRLVQLAWTTLVPGQERVGGVHVHIVQPGGFTIPEEAAAVHGLYHGTRRAGGKAAG